VADRSAERGFEECQKPGIGEPEPCHFDVVQPGQGVVLGGVGIGWLAVPPVKYEVAVPAGMSANVTIPTPGGIATGAYWPMLHVDDHVIGTYEFPQVPGADLPVMAGGMVVMKKITVTDK